MPADREAVREEASHLLAELHPPAPGMCRVLITAGPTFEDIDRVRFLANHSTGLMGLELSDAVTRAGHQAVLILGPTPLVPPPLLPTVRVRSTREMLMAVEILFPSSQALIMAAAPADYRPAEFFDGKLHKQEGDLSLLLVRNPDILLTMKPRRTHQIIAGFSLDTTVDLISAEKKKQNKGMDIIVANSNTSFSGCQTDGVILETGMAPVMAMKTKKELARYLVERVLARSQPFRLLPEDEQ